MSSSQNPSALNPRNLTYFSSCCNHSSPATTLDLLILIPSSSSPAPSSSSPFSPASSESSPKIFLFCFRKCRTPRCKGLKKALKFGVQIQTEDCVREKGRSGRRSKIYSGKVGSRRGTLIIEVLRAELRKMALVNGQTVLLFRARCECPLAKLEAREPKKRRGKIRG